MTKRSGLSLSKKELKRLKSIGEKVREFRKKLGKSVYDVTGEDMPIKSRQHWQRIENGQKNISLITLFRVAETLNISVEELLNGTGP